MAHLDDDVDFGVLGPSGEKRAFDGLDDDDEFAPKKAKVDESAPGVTTGMILGLRQSLQDAEEKLVTVQAELETSKSELQKWHMSFSFSQLAPAGTNAEPALVLTYLQNLKSSEESLREQLEKSKKKEAAFIITLSKREQEIAELKSAVRDLKTLLRPPSMLTRKLLLDPAIHEEFTRLKNLAEEKDKKIKDLEDDIAARNFTPNSKFGKLLVAKCKTLQEENEEIGKVASEGKIHELSMKLAVMKAQNTDLRNKFDALYKCMDALTNDVERSNEMVSFLQEEVALRDNELNLLRVDQTEMHKEKVDPPAADEQKQSDDPKCDVKLLRVDRTEMLEEKVDPPAADDEQKQTVDPKRDVKEEL